MPNTQSLLCAAFLTCGALCAIPKAQAQDAPAAPPAAQAQAELSAEQVLQKLALAYLNLKSYVGTSAVISTADFGDKKLTQTASAQIQFARPGKFYINGLDTGGNKFGIVSDGERDWRSWGLEKSGVWQEADSAGMAIAAMTGVAATAPTLIPGALGEFTIGEVSSTSPFDPEKHKNARLMGRESISGEDCYRIEAPGVSETWTFWISSRDFLMRQAREEQDAKQMEEMDAQARKGAAEMPATMEELLKEMPVEARKQIEAMPPAQRDELMRMMLNPPANTIKRRMLLHIFSIDSVNKLLPADLFQKPQGPRRAMR